MNHQILIIEDEPRIAMFLAKGLRHNGYCITIAQDGCEAWHLSTQDTFDLILLDIGLPDRNGLTLLKDMRDAGLHQPIMVLTAYDDPQYQQLSDRYGANDYLTKPFGFQDLLHRVNALICDTSSTN